MVVHGPRGVGTLLFQYDLKENIWKNLIGDDVDILLTHGPPFGYLDDSKGSVSLLQEIWRAKPKLVVFGHVNNARSEETVIFHAAQEY
jgi:Icc-related predicted phosphoesterase